MNFATWISEASQRILQFNDINTVLDRILLEARQLSQADAGTVFLREGSELVFAYTHNDTLFHVDMAHKYSYANARLPISTNSIAGYCATTCKPLRLDNVRDLPADLPFTFNDSFDTATGYRTVSIYCLPLSDFSNSVMGVIQLINHMENGQASPFPDGVIPSLTALAVLASNAIQRSRVVKEMILRMQMMAALNDPKETGPHVERVGAVAAEVYQAIAEKNNIPVDERRGIRDQIRLAAMLHDLGKVAIPREVLKKPGKLTDEEFAIMQTHCAAGSRLFPNSTDQLDEMAKDIALHHHQKWNGRGYTGDPDVPLLNGEDIPLAARITAVADVFDALISIRCYKTAWTWEDAINLLKNDAGSHFDPEVVEAFLLVEPTIRIIYEKYQG